MGGPGSGRRPSGMGTVQKSSRAKRMKIKRAIPKPGWAHKRR